MIYTLIYLSKITQPLDEDDVIDIATKATSKNKKLGVTGFLTFRNNCFVQFLEGKETEVTKLMDTIKLDSRHEVEHLIVLNSQPFRQFENWNMRYISPAYISRVTTDDTLIDTIRQVSENSYDQQMVNAQIYGLINRISRILYLPRYDPSIDKD